jgi:hypothetical protein
VRVAGEMGETKRKEANFHQEKADRLYNYHILHEIRLSMPMRPSRGLELNHKCSYLQ